MVREHRSPHYAAPRICCICVTRRMLHATSSMSHVACCNLHLASCMDIACCMPHVASRLLQVVCYMSHVACGLVHESPHGPHGRRCINNARLRRSGRRSVLRRCCATDALRCSCVLASCVLVLVVLTGTHGHSWALTGAQASLRRTCSFCPRSELNPFRPELNSALRTDHQRFLP